MILNKNIFVSTLLVIVLSSCEKVINFEVKGAEPVLVIEGIITNEAGPYFVIISRSQNFADSLQYGEPAPSSNHSQTLVPNGLATSPRL